jgi:hypothetical protein
LKLTAVVDNDVVFKIACYGIVDALLFSYVGDSARVGFLGVARFVLARKLRRSNLRGSLVAAQEALTGCLERCEELEPTPDEQRLAAEFELAAQRAGLRLDTGESQLCAIAIVRDVPMLLTGDKRAIVAIERLLDGEQRLGPLQGRVHCIEQLAVLALRQSGIDVVCSAVCAEPEVDLVLSICCSCSGSGTAVETALEGLDSYIRALRAEAGRVLSA